MPTLNVWFEIYEQKNTHIFINVKTFIKFLKRSKIFVILNIHAWKETRVKYLRQLIWKKTIFFQKALHCVSRSFSTIIRCRLIDWQFSWFSQFGIVASKLPSCSVSSFTNLSSSWRKRFRPFNSKVFAKPVSCLHFGQVFVNAAWPLLYQWLTHDSQPTIEEQERQQINGGFGEQMLQ